MRDIYYYFGGAAALIIIIWGFTFYTFKKDDRKLELQKKQLQEIGVAFTGENFNYKEVTYHKVLVPVNGRLQTFFCPCIQGSICWNCCADPNCTGEE